jgi:hypothetical protein
MDILANNDMQYSYRRLAGIGEQPFADRDNNAGRTIGRQSVSRKDKGHIG